IAAGDNTLVIAPTGSGKTLAAFLWALDRLASDPAPADPKLRCRVLYISPLKALAVDIERNLRAPLAGIRQVARRRGLAEPDLGVAVRTGDTAADERRRLASKPPDILITPPESLFLILTSRARDALRGVDTVIVDEVHALAGNKRGAHLALSLERLDALRADAGEDDKASSGGPRSGAGTSPRAGAAQRIGLSATVRPPPGPRRRRPRPWAGPGRSRSPPRPAASRSRSRSWCRSRTCPPSTRPPRSHRPTARTACRASWSARWGRTAPSRTCRRPPPSARSGRTWRSGCSISSGSTGPPSSSPTPADLPTGWAAGATSSQPSGRRRRPGPRRACRRPRRPPPPYRRRSWPRPARRRVHRPRSPGPTTARCPARSGRRSRRR